MKLFIICGVIVIATLLIFLNYSPINHQSVNYEKIAQGINKKVAKQLEDHERLILVETGGK